MLPRAAFLVHGGDVVRTLIWEVTGKWRNHRLDSWRLATSWEPLRYIRSRGNFEPVAALGVSYGAVAALIAAAESPDVAAVISDGAFPTSKRLSGDIRKHYLHDPKTSFLVRLAFLLSSVAGEAIATGLVYYPRSGTYLGPDLLSAIPPASRIRIPVLLL